jgi:phosphoribosylanthranilate isomerase
MTWIKICGTTNLEDAECAIEAGANALGFVFARSPRQVDGEQARQIISELPAEIEKIGVFDGGSAEEIRATAEHAGLTAIQIYCDQDPALGAKLAADLGIPAYLAISAASLGHGLVVKGLETMVRGIVIDSGNAAQRGGTGQRFDWAAARPFIQCCSRIYPVIVAGGLKPENVGEAVRLLQPWGVDVVSGVERSPGRKDPEKLRAFVKTVRRAEQEE